MIVIEFTTTLRDVNTTAAIMRATKIPDYESPLVLKFEINDRKDPVTKVTKQKKMSKI